MSYRIRYQEQPRPLKMKFRAIRLPMMTLLAFILFLMLVHSRWQEGAAFLRSLAPWLQESNAVVAFDRLVGQLQSEEPLLDVFSAFWNEWIP